MKRRRCLLEFFTFFASTDNDLLWSIHRWRRYRSYTDRNSSWRGRHPYIYVRDTYTFISRKRTRTLSFRKRINLRRYGDRVTHALSITEFTFTVKTEKNRFPGGKKSYVLSGAGLIKSKKNPASKSKLLFWVLRDNLRGVDCEGKTTEDLNFLRVFWYVKRKRKGNLYRTHGYYKTDSSINLV